MSGTKETNVRIESLATGGDGVGRIEGKVCFVPHAAPGDLLKVKVVRENRNMVRAEIVSVEEPGTSRRESPCTLAGICGGCQWLHLSYDEQLRTKTGFLQKAVGDIPVEVTRSPSELEYRCVARLHYQPTADRNGILGFAQSGSRELVDISNCPVLEPAINKCLSQLRRLLQTTVDQPMEVRVALGHNGPVVSFTTDKRLPVRFYSAVEAALPDLFSGVVVHWDGLKSVLSGDGTVTVDGGDGKPLVYPAGSFSQANTYINHQLSQTVGEWAAGLNAGRAMELYAGAGNLTVMLAPVVTKLATVELDGDACRYARMNIASRNLKGVTIHVGDALKVYKSIGKGADLVVLDPPRPGAGPLAGAMAGAPHTNILYVSCDMATLGRDIATLQRGGYRPAKARGFDMFPETSHMEAVVLLTRESSHQLPGP